MCPSPSPKMPFRKHFRESWNRITQRPSSSSSRIPLPTLPPASELSSPKSQPTSSAFISTDLETKSSPNLQERIWNQAYDELRANESEVIDAFEKILLLKINGQTSQRPVESTENNIGKTREITSHDIQQLVRDGLARTEREASIKERIGDGLQPVQAVRSMVEKAVQAAPEAAAAWACVCLGLEVRIVYG